VESEDRSRIPFFVIISELFGIAFPDRKWIGLVRFDIRGCGLDIEENRFL
jgi:hypothetical protein